MFLPNSTARPAGPPRRVLLFSGSYNHITDGVTLTLNRLVAYLESQGTEVLVVAPTTESPALHHAGTLAPVPSVPVPGRGEYRFATILPPTIRARITRFKPEIVHVATPDLIGRWAMSYARRKGIPVVATYHTDFISYLGYYGLDFLETLVLSYQRYFYRRCELICVPSQSMIDKLKARGVEGNMRVWGRGVETDRFNPERRSIKWRRGLGIADGVPIITYVGRLVWEKNIRCIVDIAHELRKRRVPHHVMIVGEGPAREELESLLPDAIFAGHLSGTDIARAYASSDIFFFPSTTETFGNVVLEAMASGLPCVCVQATGSSDLVAHGSNGYLIPPEDMAGLVAGIEALAVDQTLREEMGKQSLKLAHEYRWEALMEKMLEYYAEARWLAVSTPPLQRVLGLPPTRPD